MKFILNIVILFIVCICVVSCQHDEDISLAMMNVKNEQIESSYTSVTVECLIECNVTFDEVLVECALTEDFIEPITTVMKEEEGMYRAQYSDLLDDTTYYVRYTISNRISSMIYDQISTFRTLTPSIPIVHMDSISNIWDVKADAFAHVEFDGGATITEWGVDLRSEIDSLRIKAHSLQQTIFILSNLLPNTSYSVRVYAINKKGIAYSNNDISFTTFALPEVQTDKIVEIQLTSAILNGTLIFNGNDTAVVKGFCWSEKEEATIEDNHVQINTLENVFSYHLSNLNDETQYQVRTYAKNKIGIVYGETNSFTTQSAVIPTVSTNEVTNVEYHTATIAADVMSDGGANVTERGICYSTTENPTIESSKIVSGKGTGNYTSNLTGLQDSTTYYVRAYAINKKGIAYGEQVSFMTKGYKLPTITTVTPSNIEYHSATVGGNILSDGGAEVTERGICYSTTENPTIESTKIVSGKGTGSYTVNLTGLQDSTTYYVRAYAINKKGIAYGEQVSFMTKGYMFPIITTANPTNVEYHSASVGGNILSDGGAEVTERGICYSTTENPTIESTKIVSGKGTGSYTVNLTGLQDSTTYYVRAYAINSKGTAYGEQNSFTTKAYTLPIVTTSYVTNISYLSATVGGDVTSDGGTTVTERGICYSTIENPTIEGNKIVSGKGTGSYTLNLSDLQDSTTYYVRAYAINKKGIAYGEQVTFMTKGYKLPTITTTTPTNIEYHSATVGGDVTSDGGAEVTERGICYSTTENPTIESIKMVSGKGTGSYTSNLTGLQDSTTYYVRAYAINKKGIAYGEQVSFMTKGYQLPTIMTSYVTNISYLSATVGGDVTSDGGTTVTERGIVYSTSQNPTTSNSKVQSGSGTGSFTCLLNNLQESTTYYIRAYAQNAKGINYGNQMSITTIEKPYFTVGESQKISFSSGNLQYHPADNKWRFAENQTDYIGESNRNMSSSYNGWVDLFYWSSSKCRFGVTKPDITTHAGLFVDWGTTQIGSDAPNTWRTLTYDEWDYLRHMRANADVLCGVAMVNGVNGLVFLPDNWTCPVGVSFKPGFHSNDGVDYYAAYQTFTTDLWLKLEASGAVFLPAAGACNGNLSFDLQNVGRYWSATQQNHYYIYYLYFSSTKAEVDEYTREFRISVRLVKDL